MININRFSIFMALSLAAPVDAFLAPQNVVRLQKLAPLHSTDGDQGMSEYDRQMAAAVAGAQASLPTVTVPAPVPAYPAPVNQAWTPAPAVPAASVTASPVSGAADAISQLDVSQQDSLNAIAAAIPDLAPKADLAWSAQSGVTIGGATAILDARDAPGPANIAWLASLCIDGKESSLTIFNGPLTNVPHLLSRVCVINDNTLSFALDFRPRAYGAYEKRNPQTGEYPGPEELGRVAFEYSGNRKEFENSFGTDDVTTFMEATKASFEGATDNGPNSELEQLTGGPLAISMTMPLTAGNVAAIASAREKAASYWLKWATDGTHEHRPGAPVNTQVRSLFYP